jgi:hypothetical protein
LRKLQQLMAIMTTAILISLIASSSFASAQIINLNPDEGTTWTAGDGGYLSASNSAYSAAAQYGDLLNTDYEWWSHLGNTAERTNFNPGPAPDRPDILWSSDNIEDYGTPYDGNVAFAGKLFSQVNKPYQGETRQHLAAMDPFTGEQIWATLLPEGMTFAVFGTTFIHRVNDEYIMALMNAPYGLAMFRVSDGKLMWNDGTIVPNAAYHRMMYAADLMYLFGPISITNQNEAGYGQYMNTAWDLSDPGVDKGEGGRVAWEDINLTNGRV